VLRPPEEFPTPAFRLMCGWLTGGIVAALWLLIWADDGRGDRITLVAAAVLSAALPLRFGGTVPRLVASSAAAALLVTGVFLVELAL
jgi:hypothetical protein